MIQLPAPVDEALRRLTQAGFAAYIVGGCVRDHLRGSVPTDYDITTDALPAETKQVFAGERVIETGIRHGTVTVCLGGMALEITTFRVDAAYSDNRHPDAVSFTRSLRADTARRDFTMNAIAYNERVGFVDYFGGRADIARHLIRCVGEADMRFQEDALRILRALRFSSVLGFSIDAETARAAHRNRQLLQHISAERIAAELTKLLLGPHVRQVLLDYADVLGVAIPELLPMQGFAQHNKHHIYDVLTHTAIAVEAAPATPALRLAALLHDIGKPACFTRGDDGVGHFYGHAAHSARLANQILRRLKFDNATRTRVVLLVREHDTQIAPTARGVRRALAKLTPEGFFQLLALKRADNLAQSPAYRARQQTYDALEALATQILDQAQCFQLRDLAVDGRDLLAAGIPAGPAVGAALRALLDAVISEQAPNEKAALLQFLQCHGFL